MKRRAFFLWLLIIMILLISGCDNDNKPKTNSKEKTVPILKEPSLTLENIHKNLPLPMEEGELERVYGWFGKHSILYTTIEQGITYIYTYDLLNGKNQYISEVNGQVDSIDISPQGKYVLIRSSYDISESLITIYNQEGQKVFVQEWNVFDVYIDWNPYNEEEILLSTFTDEWMDESFLLSISEKTMKKVDLPNPFVYWLNKNELVYQSSLLEENTNELMKIEISSGKKTQVLEDAYYVDTFKNYLLSIHILEKEAIYYFYQNNLEPYYSFSIPLLSREFDWIVSQYDLIEQENLFLTFEQKEKDLTTSNSNDYLLYKYNLETKEKKLVMEGLKNEPIDCSPEGSICLYGYYFENLIDMNKKEKTPLL